MATVAETLTTALESLATKYATAAENATPSYTIDGQTVNRVEYMESLLRQMQAIQEQINNASGPIEINTHGMV